MNEKTFMINILQNKLNIIKFRIKCIEDINNNKIIINKNIIEQLEKLEYPKLHKNIVVPEFYKNYDYILEMFYYPFREKNIDKLHESENKLMMLLKN